MLFGSAYKHQNSEIIFYTKNKRQYSTLDQREIIKENARKSSGKTLRIFFFNCALCLLTLSWRGPLSYRNQSIDFLCKSMDWFLYDNSLRHERFKYIYQLLRGESYIDFRTHCVIMTFVWVVTNAVLKFKKFIEFESWCIVICFSYIYQIIDGVGSFVN